MKTLKHFFAVGIVFFILFCNAKGQIWPVKNNNFCVTQNFCDTYSGFHDGIDIHDYNINTHSYVDSSVVVAVRNGTVKFVGDVQVGNAVVIETANKECDIYLHLDSVKREVVVGKQVKQGDTIAVGLCGDGGPHLHFCRTTHYFPHPTHPGLTPDRTNTLNPFFLFGKDFDPQKNPPRLIDTDNNGKVLFINQANRVICTDIQNPKIYGNVDIAAETHDVQIPDNWYNDPQFDYYHIPQIPMGIGYQVSCVSHQNSNIDFPYQLCKFDDKWFPQGGMLRFFELVYFGSPYFHTQNPSQYFTVTNTRGTDGSVANVDSSQFWRTRAKINTGTQPNGSDAQMARHNGEAKFRDGNYRVHIVMEDLIHKVDDSTTQVIVDNFPPYVKKVVVQKENNQTVYSRNWLCTNGTMSFPAATTNGAINTGEDFFIEITTSEPMNILSFTFKEISNQPTLKLNQGDTLFRFSVPKTTYAGVCTMKISGKDKADNLLFKNGTTMPVRNENGIFSPFSTQSFGIEERYNFIISNVYTDLIIKSQTADSTNILAGNKTQVRFRAKNIGNNSLISVTHKCGIYLSTNTTFEQNIDTHLASLSVSTKDSSLKSLQITIPKCESGQKYILFVADIGNAVNEINETNNVSYIAINIRPLPDLAIVSIELDTSHLDTTHEIMHYFLTEMNISPTGTSIPHSIKVFFSKNNFLDEKAILIKFFWIDLIPAYQTVVCNNSILTDTILSGSYYLLFVVNGENFINECNKFNNFAYQRIYIPHKDSTFSPKTEVQGQNFSNFLHIFPNPVQENLNIELSLPQEDVGKISIFNLQGQEILIIKQGILQNERFSLPFQHLAAGIYFVKLKTTKFFETKKIVK